VDHSELLNKCHELDQQLEQLRNGLQLSKPADVQAGAKRKRNLNAAAEKSANCKQSTTNGKTMGTQEAYGHVAETSIDSEAGEECGECKSIWEFLAVSSL
jgi:hypothetical protein